MKPPMNHTIYKVSYTRNAYGDYEPTGETAYRAHVRVITEHVTQRNELIDTDAMIWVDADTPCEENSIWKIYGEHYRVERRIEARKLRNPTIQFIKCELVKYGIIS